MIDVRREGELRFAQAQAAHPWSDVAERGHKSVDPECVRILGKIRIDAVQNHRNGGVHRAFTGGTARSLSHRLLRARQASAEVADSLAQDLQTTPSGPPLCVG